MAFPAEVVSCLLKSQTVWPGCRPSICPMNAAPPGETCSVGDVIETVNGTLGCLFSPQCHTVRAFVTTATTIPPKAVSTPVQIAALTALSRPDCVVGPGEVWGGWLVTWSRPSLQQTPVFGQSTRAHGVAAASPPPPSMIGCPFPDAGVMRVRRTRPCSELQSGRSRLPGHQRMDPQQATASNDLAVLIETEVNGWLQRVFVVCVLRLPIYRPTWRYPFVPVSGVTAGGAANCRRPTSMARAPRRLSRRCR
jgi:hypothetical protein